jgi:hypothetical protein
MWPYLVNEKGTQLGRGSFFFPGLTGQRRRDAMTLRAMVLTVC